MESLTMSFQPTETLHSVDGNCTSYNHTENQNRHVRFDSASNQIYTIEPLFDYHNDIWWKLSELEQLDKQQQQQVTQMKHDCSLILDFFFSKKSIFFIEIPTSKPAPKEQQDNHQRTSQQAKIIKAGVADSNCTLILDFLFSKKSIYSSRFLHQQSRRQNNKTITNK